MKKRENDAELAGYSVKDFGNYTQPSTFPNIYLLLIYLMYMSTSLFRLQRFALILLLLCGNFSLMQAQRFLITGTAQEEKTNAAVEFASVALLRPDSTGISAVTTSSAEVVSE